MAGEEQFVDGNVSAVVRVGDTVRRATGPWTPTVQALLRHLERRGFDGAPRALGLDEQGREVLSFVPGQTMPPSLEGVSSDHVLVAVAKLLRRFHDATLGFEPPPDAVWRFQVDAPRAGEVVCHNDVAPWNVIVRDGQPVALIDFDFAAPGPRDWDVAHALWRFAPLYPDAELGSGDEFGSPEEQGRRMRVFCDAYGLSDRGGLVDTIERRQRALHESLIAWAAAGEPAFVRMVRDGHGDGLVRGIAYLRRHRDLFQRALND